MRYNKKEVTTKQKPYLGKGGPRDQQRRQQKEDSGNEEIKELKKQIDKLTKELKTPKNHYTGEQVDAEIRKAVKEALLETGKADPIRFEELETKIFELETNEEAKNKTIEKLKKELIKSRTIIANFEKKNDEQVAMIVKLETQNEALKEIFKNKEEFVGMLKENKNIGSSELMELISKQIGQLTNAIELKKVVLDPNRPKMKDVIIDPVEKMNNFESHIKIKNVSSDKEVDMGAKVNKLKSLIGDKLPSQKQLIKRGEETKEEDNG